MQIKLKYSQTGLLPAIDDVKYTQQTLKYYHTTKRSNAYHEKRKITVVITLLLNKVAINKITTPYIDSFH
jgi:hypothetical protein